MDRRRLFGGVHLDSFPAGLIHTLFLSQGAVFRAGLEQGEDSPERVQDEHLPPVVAARMRPLFQIRPVDVHG